MSDSLVLANASDPQATVQTFIDLIGRHEKSFYQFVHQVHTKGQGLFDDLMRWIELFINLVRDGFPQKVSLEFLLPHAGQERAEVMAEIDAVIEYHRKLKVAHHQRMRRRMIKGETTNKDEDSAFVEGVMQNLNIAGISEGVEDLNAEDSEDEGEDGNSSDDGSFADAVEQQPHQSTSSIPTRPKRSKKKDRAVIEAPELKIIPRYVPIFTEMLRPALMYVLHGMSLSLLILYTRREARHQARSADVNANASSARPR